MKVLAFLFNYFDLSFIESPRLCVHHLNPSQYYPCALNYIGLNSWSLNQCPNQFIFDEQSQQCLMKVPVTDAFEKILALSSVDNSLFQKITNFILSKQNPKEEQIAEEELTNELNSFAIEDRLNDVMKLIFFL